MIEAPGGGQLLLSCLGAISFALLPAPELGARSVDGPSANGPSVDGPSLDAAPANEPSALAGQVADLCHAGRSGSSLACDAYLRGVYEGLVAGQTSTPIESTSFCPPDAGLAPAEIRRVFLDFVDADAARRAEEAGWSLLSALEDDFPCSGAGELPLPGAEDAVEATT